MHIKIVTLLGNFSFGLNNFLNFSTTFFIQRFSTFFIFSIKRAFFNVFYSWCQRFLHLCLEPLAKRHIAFLALSLYTNCFTCDVICRNKKKFVPYDLCR